MNCIHFKKGYKYQLASNYLISTKIFPVRTITTLYISLGIDGELYIKEGYAWDGPSGPTVDTPNFMRGSLVHDALYQLIREGHLSLSYRRPADEELKRICREDGMSWARTQWVYLGVRWGAGFAADPANKKPVITAPKSCKEKKEN